MPDYKFTVTCSVELPDGEMTDDEAVSAIAGEIEGVLSEMREVSGPESEVEVVSVSLDVNVQLPPPQLESMREKVMASYRELCVQRAKASTKAEREKTFAVWQLGFNMMRNAGFTEDEMHEVWYEVLG